MSLICSSPASISSVYGGHAGYAQFAAADAATEPASIENARDSRGTLWISDCTLSFEV